MSSLTINWKSRSLPALSIMFAMWATTLCSSLPFGATPAQAKILGLSEQEEIQAGQEVAAQAEKEFGGVLPANHAMSRRVRALGQQFAQLSQRKNIPYTYKVLNNNEVLNAFAAPGGPIYVTKKLVDATANDAELAYVLGHETAHIDRKHIVKQVEKQQKAGIIAGILGAVLGGRAGNVVGTVANVGWAVISRGYSRDDENESDTVGVRWMSQLGYDPKAAISMLGKLGGGSGGGLDKYLSTHPAPKDRQARVQNLIQQENLMDVARRRGGPKLSANLPNNYYSTASTSYGYPAYGTEDSAPEYSNPQDYDAPVYYPPTSTYPTSPYPQNQEINLGAPLVIVQGEGSQVIMAPVSGIVRWAGASVQANGNVYTVRRGNSVIELRRYSRIATLNGRSIRLPAAPDVHNGLLYAPLGNLAEAVGAQATLDANSRTVRLTLGSNNSGFVRVP